MGRGPFHREYPWGGRIPIDAKATGKKFLEAIDIDDEEAKKQLYVDHAKAMKGRVNELNQTVTEILLMVKSKQLPCSCHQKHY